MPSISTRLLLRQRQATLIARVSAASIRPGSANTHVVDDKTILFYMRGGDVYRNTLRFDCPGLKRENRFSYKVTASRLCGVDSIRVLESFGRNLTAGVSCGLTEFYPISEDEADFLRYGDRNELQEEPEAVDLPDDEED